MITIHVIFRAVLQRNVIFSNVILTKLLARWRYILNSISIISYIMRLLIAIPSNTGRLELPVPFVFSLIQAIRQIPAEIEVDLKYFGGLRIDAVRLNMVSYAKRHDFTHLLMIDDDMALKPDTILRLLNRAGEGCQVVSALYQFKVYPYHFFLMPKGSKEWLRAYKQQLYEVDAIGTGCILIDMAVFDRLAHPFFLLRMDCQGQITKTEDCYFAENCRLNNVQIYVDATILCNHIKTITFPDFWNDPYHHYHGKLPFRPGIPVGNVVEKPRANNVCRIPQFNPMPVPKLNWQDGIDE